MSTKKIEKKHSHFHWVHLLAAFILGGYFISSKVNLVHALTNESPLVSFMQIYLFGVFFACLFLYVFSHDNFFKFAKDIEKKNEKKEKRYLEKYLHHGKILATFIIGVMGGPVFSSLTARLLLNNYAFKYILIILANIPSTIITVGVSRGAIHIFGF